MLSDSRDAGIAEIGLGLAALGRPGYINLGHGADVADARREEMAYGARRARRVFAAPFHRFIPRTYAIGARTPQSRNRSNVAG